MNKHIITIYTFLFVLFSTSTAIAASSQNINSYYPSPFASYDSIRLVPRPNLSTPCPNGVIYLRDDFELLICQDEQWQPFNEAIWEAPFGNFIIQLIDKDRHVKVGVGTDDPKFRLHIKDGGIFAKKGSNCNATLWNNDRCFMKHAQGITFYFQYQNKIALRSGQVTGDHWRYAPSAGIDNVGNFSYVFGFDNQAASDYTSILGGANNTIDQIYGVIGGGEDNSISSLGAGRHAVIAGGIDNEISAPYSFIGGGGCDTPDCVTNGHRLSATHSVIGGGISHDTDSQYSVIIGGEQNSLQGSDYSVIGGGGYNLIMDSSDAVILGGYSNNIVSAASSVKSDYSVIGGGLSNYIDSSTAATIIGGGGDNALSDLCIERVGLADFCVTPIGNIIRESNYATILGGATNIIEFSPYASIGGGIGNIVSAEHSVIGGGFTNRVLGTSGTAYGTHSFIGGGFDNEISKSTVIPAGEVQNGQYAVIGGGYSNIAQGQYSFVGGGQENEAIADYSVIPGGRNNIVEGRHSLAFGRQLHVTGNRTFAWGYSDEIGDHDSNPATPDEEIPIMITADDAFIIADHHVTALGGRVPIQVGIFTDTIDATAKVEVNGDIQARSFYIANVVDVSNDTQMKLDAKKTLGIDLAETFASSEKVSVGDLMVIDPNSPGKIKKSSKHYDTNVVGVVSMLPAILLEGDSMQMAPLKENIDFENEPPIALAGQVMLKVTTENGAIAKGDALTSSSTPGHAMKASDANKSFGAIVAKAMEPFSRENNDKEGMIRVLITRH